MATNTKSTVTITLKNSAGCELDSRTARNDEDVKRQLLDMVENDTICAGDSIHITLEDEGR